MAFMDYYYYSLVLKITDLKKIGKNSDIFIFAVEL
jgi:hypothetical protein